MTRRGVLGAAGLAGADRAARLPQGTPQVVVWETVPCPGCGLVVCFLPGHRRNKCAWCKTVVRRAV